MRITLGSVFIAHSLYLKLVVFTLSGTAQFFESISLPSLLAYLVFLVEAITGVAIVVGFKTRLSTIAVLPVLFGATWVHWQFGWLFTNQGGGWEYPLVLILMTVALYFLGEGKFSLSAQLTADEKVGYTNKNAGEQV